ncbi:MAG: hypothetical protein WAM60_12550, partial [Candidatus Promineifilaceae bacterium]
MFPNSIRHRLPLSYGAIALLATLFLGIALVTSLSSYYHNQEQAYLEKNAQSIADLIGRLILTGTSESPADHLQLLQSQVNTFSFITQVQIRIFDPAHDLLADSGNPQALQATSTLSLQVAVGDEDQFGEQSFSQTIGTEEEGVRSTIQIVSGQQRIESETSIVGNTLEDPLSPEKNISLSLLETPFNFGPGFTAEPNVRSTATYETPILNPDNELLGYVELSQGPAFGRSIVQDIIIGLIVAGIIATTLAAAIGW